MKQLLGPQRFEEMRQRIMGQQDVFQQQLWEMHRLSKRQRYLMCTNPEPERVQAELLRLHGEVADRQDRPSEVNTL